MTDPTATGGSAPRPERPADDTTEPELTDPGSKTQPAEGGRDEATDGGATDPGRGPQDRNAGHAGT
jgi:hypothetical protein